MADSSSPADVFRSAVEAAGGQTRAAKICGVTQGAIWQRLNKRKPAAPGWVIPLEKATGISRSDLASSLYPRPERDRADASGFEHVR